MILEKESFVLAAFAIAIVILNFSRKEWRNIWRSKIIAGITASLWILGPRLFYYCLVIPVSLTGKSIRPEKLYLCMALLFIISHSLIGGINLAVRCVAESIPSCNRLKVSLIGGINLAVRCVAESIPSCNRLKVSLIGGINLAVRCVAESIPSCNRLKVSLIGGINLAVRCVAESIPSCNRLKVSLIGGINLAVRCVAESIPSCNRLK